MFSMDRFLSRYLKPKQKQWVWFILLYLSGIAVVSTLAYTIRFALGLT